MASELIDTAQAILTATDTAISKAYRDEDRVWRKDDLAWREQERQLMCAAHDPPRSRLSACVRACKCHPAAG
jgi:hypothetical protein